MNVRLINTFNIMMFFMDDNFIQEIQKAFGATENMLKNHSGGLVAMELK